VKLGDRGWSAALSPEFALLALLFLALLFMGGASRGDVQSLVVLRPLFALGLGTALLLIPRESFRNLRFSICFMIALAMLPLLHLVPLPPALWQSLPGRELEREVLMVVGAQDSWQPLSLAPARTWNALFSLLIPATMLLLSASLTKMRLSHVLALLIALGLISGIFGLLQAASPGSDYLYLYRIRNSGQAVGLFANRNHQAVLLACMLPILATFASLPAASRIAARMRMALCVSAGAFIVALLLVTGSRAGLLVGLIGLLSSLWLYRPAEVPAPAKRSGRRMSVQTKTLIGVGLCLLVVCLTYFSSRAQAIDRLISHGAAGELRFRVWGSVVDMAKAYFPVGSGVSAFIEAYQVNEPAGLARLTYLNNAHNDWLELIATSGAPAIAFMLVAVVAWVKAAWLLARPPRLKGELGLAGRLGLVVILIIAVASVFDYPLRVPTLAGFFAFCAGAVEQASRKASRWRGET